MAKKATFLTGNNDLLCIYDGGVSLTVDDTTGSRDTVIPAASPDYSRDIVLLDNATIFTGDIKPASNTSSDAACFPASAFVEKKDGSIIPISAVNVGDTIRTGADSFSDVFMFTHRNAVSVNEFVKLTTSEGASVTLTAGHYLHVEQKNSLVAAVDVMVGDSLVLAFAKDAASVVVTKESVSGLGLYNPQTVDGSIVVDGFLASAYTTAVHPKVAHCSLAPIRWLYEQLPYDILRDFLGSLFATGSPKAAAFLPTGPSIVSLYGVWRMDRPD
jgi:Hint module